MSRFEKQIILSGFGEERQMKLQRARVLVIGAGGLGCPALTYLAAAGVGVIGICDGDEVCYSNLNRQVIYGEYDVGKSKTSVAARYLREKYSDIHVDEMPFFLDNTTALDVISGYDIVVDCSDNFATRYMISDACVLLQKVLVLGAIYKYEGHLCVLNLPGKSTINYRDLYPEPPAAHELPDCSDTGVLGVLPGIIGCLQAAEVIKVITGIGEPLAGRILYYHLLSQSFYESVITRNEEAQKQVPSSKEVFLKTDYSLTCRDVEEISWEEAFRLQNTMNGNYLFVDVRGEGELPAASGFDFVKVPLTMLEERKNKFLKADGLFLFCQSGSRSSKAVHALRKILPGKKMYSIKGGMNLFSPENLLQHGTQV